MKTWEALLSDTPSDDEKRTLIRLVHDLARAKKQKPQEVYDRAVRLARAKYEKENPVLGMGKDGLIVR